VSIVVVHIPVVNVHHAVKFTRAKDSFTCDEFRLKLS
jgi:hypothetical protein